MWCAQHSHPTREPTNRKSVMQDSSIWWLVAGAAIVAELLMGTFYLLMMTLGLVAATMASHRGLPMALQMVAAASVGGGAVFGCYCLKKKRPGDPSEPADCSVNRDVGETIPIDRWGADGTAP